MPLLYYWRGDNYRRDLDYGAGYHLNQANPLLHDVLMGESLWAFTRRIDGTYVLAAELVVSAKTLNPKNYRYGKYRVWGDLGKSRYFRLEGQPDITGLIRKLSVRAHGDVLGRAFQGRAAVRHLSKIDDQHLISYAARLPPEPRARLLPEERLEALPLAGDEEAVGRLLRDEPSGLAEKRRKYLMTRAVTCDRSFTMELQQIYRGRCQICGWEPKRRYGTELCEARHVRWLSRGGEDNLNNLVLVCPNHHRAIHRCDAPFDWEQWAFVFSSAPEFVTLREHNLLLT